MAANYLCGIITIVSGLGMLLWVIVSMSRGNDR